MAKTSRRTPEEIEQLLMSYEQSGLSRRQYCDQQGIAVTTFDYYRHRQLKGRRVPSQALPLVRVKLKEGYPDRKGFTLVLAKDRRIESNWSCNKQDLMRLIRIVEAA